MLQFTLVLFMILLHQAVAMPVLIVSKFLFCTLYLFIVSVGVLFRLITLSDTYKLGRTPLDKGSARPRYISL